MRWLTRALVNLLTRTTGTWIGAPDHKKQAKR
jgi:hypothetical protein